MTKSKKEDVNNLYEAAINRKPVPGNWGIQIEHDMGGLVAFLWTESKTEFIKLMRLYADWIYQEEEPAQEDIEQLNEMSDRFDKGHLSSMHFCNELEGLIGEYLVHWCGTFDSLLSEDDEFSRTVRSAFWDNYENEEQQGSSYDPIPDSLVDNFAETVTGDQY